jgi:hypothetical protein
MMMMMIALVTLCAASGARGMDDDDSAQDMLADFIASTGTVALYDENTGEKIEGSMAIVSPSWERGSSHVGVFLPAAAVKKGMKTTTVTLCEFSNPDACVNEKPYAGATDEFACGEDDEARDDTGFDCDEVEVPIEPDGDLSVDIELEDPEYEVDYEDAAPPAPARKLLSTARIHVDRVRFVRLEREVRFVGDTTHSHSRL